MTFFKDGLMRKPKKQLCNILLTKKVDTDPTLLHVLDGRAPSHKVRWRTSATFGEVFKLYVDHITSKHNISTVVFGGYSDTPSTKDNGHARKIINKRGCADVQ